MALEAEQLQQDDPQRRRILAAAREIFLESAPEHATMDAVAQRAGMSKKTIYRHFDSQLKLLVALKDEASEDLVLSPDEIDGRGPEAMLSHVLVRVIEHLLAPNSMALARLLLSELRRYPELARQMPQNAPFVILVARFLRTPAIANHFDVWDPEEAARMLMGMVLQDAPIRFLIGSEPPPPMKEIRRRADMAVNLFLHGVSAATHVARRGD